MFDDNEDQLTDSFDANDPDSIIEAEKESLRLRNKKLRIIESIMNDEDGRAWMFDFLDSNCHIFSENSLNGTIERNAKFEGERAVGLRVLSQVMEASPEMFWKMRMEVLEREKAKK